MNAKQAEMLRDMKKKYGFSFTSLANNKPDEQEILKIDFSKYTKDINEKNAEVSVKLREKGNDYFQEDSANDNNVNQALHYYSKSVSFAPKGSEALALAFNNRSVVLLFLNQYESSIEDIDNALNVTKNPVTKAKLLSRKVACLKSLDEISKIKDVVNKANKALEEVQLVDPKMKQRILKDLHKALKNEPEEPKKINNKKIESKMTKSDKISSLSKGVKINYNKEYGLHLVAQKEIKTGEPIVIEKSFCASPNLDNIHVLCSSCMRQSWNTIPCDDCVFAVYCSAKCKDYAKSYHAIECKIFKFLFDKQSARLDFNKNQEIKGNQILAVKILIKIIKETGIKKLIEEINKLESTEREKSREALASASSKMNLESFEFLYTILCHHTEKQSKSSQDLHKSFGKKVINHLKNLDEFKEDLTLEVDKKLQNLFLKFANIVSVNGDKFEIVMDYHNCNVHSGTIGHSLNLISSLINHSCHANVQRFYLDGPRIIFYAERPIKKNEQIFYSYGATPEMSAEARKARLEKYFFTCKCQACVENWPILTEQLKQSLEPRNQASANEYWAKVTNYTMGLMKCGAFNKDIINHLCEIVDTGYLLFNPMVSKAICSSYQQSIWTHFNTMYGFKYEIDVCNKSSIMRL